MGRDLVLVARRLLMAVASGEAVPWEDVDELVDGVLGGELVALALAVRGGGKHAVVRAVQLAGMIAAAGAGADVEQDDDDAEGGAS